MQTNTHAPRPPKKPGTDQTFPGFRQLRSDWRQQPLDQAPVASSEDPDSAIALQAVLSALAELPDSLREPLVLFAQGGLSYEAIAERLQLPGATVKIPIFRARQKLEKFR